MAIDLKQINTARISKNPSFSRKSRGKDPGFWEKDIHLFKKGINDKKKEEFYSELAVLLSSGIDIRTSLEIIIEEQAQPVMKEFYTGVYDHVVLGLGLSEAMFRTGKITLYEYYSLKIGEESGKMREVLLELSQYFLRGIKQRKQLVSSLTYPVMVLITAFVAVFFMLKFIVPMFTEVFKRFQGDLPPLTRFIISMSESFSKNAGIFFLLVLLIIFLIMSFREKIWFRRCSSGLLLKIPVLGEIINKVYLARFCQSMALLLGSKTPMLKTIQLVRNMIGFYPFERALISVEEDVLRGILLNQSMQKFDIFDKRIVALTRVAEEVNQLDKIYSKLNAQYSDELEHQIGIIGNLLEPAMIIIVGLLVAVVLISMYLPLFQLSTSIM